MSQFYFPFTFSPLLTLKWFLTLGKCASLILTLPLLVFLIFKFCEYNHDTHLTTKEEQWKEAKFFWTSENVLLIFSFLLELIGTALTCTYNSSENVQIFGDLNMCSKFFPSSYNSSN